MEQPGTDLYRHWRGAHALCAAKEMGAKDCDSGTFHWLCTSDGMVVFYAGAAGFCLYVVSRSGVPEESADCAFRGHCDRLPDLGRGLSANGKLWRKRKRLFKSKANAQFDCGILGKFFSLYFCHYADCYLGPFSSREAEKMVWGGFCGRSRPSSVSGLAELANRRGWPDRDSTLGAAVPAERVA